MLPFLGIFLFLTPIPAIFKDAGTAQGIPPIFTYMYGIWLMLIVASAVISIRIHKNDRTGEKDQMGNSPK